MSATVIATPRWACRPDQWTIKQRSTATIVLATAGMVAVLWLAASVLVHAPEPIGSNARAFADGMLVTMQLTLLAGLSGVLLGVLAALGKLSKFLPLRCLASAYVWIMRGTPLLVQILFVYFALPALFPWLRLSDFASACIALSLNVGAYNGEAIRAGLLCVPKGQAEAAHSLGLGPWQTLWDITFPQAFKVSLPPLVNNLVALLKDSSLAYAVGVVELTNVGNRVQSATFEPVPILITTATLYLVMTTLLTRVSAGVEQRFDIERRQP
jgi:polar amino acid transport system permease protein